MMRHNLGHSTSSITCYNWYCEYLGVKWKPSEVKFHRYALQEIIILFISNPDTSNFTIL